LTKRTALVFVFSVLAFIIVPASLYLASYIPFMIARAPAHPHDSPVALVLKEQKSMYAYHAGITESHPYSSVWYEWPVMTRPIWYYTGRDQLPPGKVSDIYAFGNPAVWWTGIIAAGGLALAMLAAGAVFAVRFLRQSLRRGPPSENDPGEAGKNAAKRTLQKLGKPGFFIIIAFASQYVPWIVIPRQLTFIYHFFASVPFLVFCIVHLLKLTAERWPRWRWAAAVLPTGALALFVLFYPLLSGALADADFVASFLRWFPGWFPYL
jgi:dolichyl-phosphate-mannose--protein O-mannosyl transferase